jgi:hypothetical protein
LMSEPRWVVRKDSDVIRIERGTTERAMPISTVKARPVKPGALARRVSEIGDTLREALAWLADELRWERTLNAARAGRLMGVNTGQAFALKQSEDSAPPQEQ